MAKTRKLALMAMFTAAPADRFCHRSADTRSRSRSGREARPCECSHAHRHGHARAARGGAYPARAHRDGQRVHRRRIGVYIQHCRRSPGLCRHVSDAQAVFGKASVGSERIRRYCAQSRPALRGGINYKNDLAVSLCACASGLGHRHRRVHGTCSNVSRPPTGQKV